MVQRVTPYLSVNGAAAAIDFYRRAFGATEITRMQADDGTRILHAVVQINGGVVMLSDEFPEYNGTPAPTAANPTSVSVAIEFDAPAEVDATFRQAVDAGANGWMQPENMFWGARFAMLDDPFGHRWMLSAQLPPEV
jgi:PhnB protein